MDLSFPLPADPSLVGATRFAQGAFLDPLTPGPPSLTNALRLTLGQP